MITYSNRQLILIKLNLHWHDTRSLIYDYFGQLFMSQYVKILIRIDIKSEVRSGKVLFMCSLKIKIPCETLGHILQYLSYLYRKCFENLSTVSTSIILESH